MKREVLACEQSGEERLCVYVCVCVDTVVCVCVCMCVLGPGEEGADDEMSWCMNIHVHTSALMCVCLHAYDVSSVEWRWRCLSRLPSHEANEEGCVQESNKRDLIRNLSRRACFDCSLVVAHIAVSKGHTDTGTLVTPWLVVGQASRAFS
jgi:hypothetical protein